MERFDFKNKEKNNKIIKNNDNMLNSIFFRKIKKDFPLIDKILFNYLKAKNPLTISDLNFKTKYACSYSLSSEKNLPEF